MSKNRKNRSIQATVEDTSNESSSISSMPIADSLPFGASLSVPVEESDDVLFAKEDTTEESSVEEVETLEEETDTKVEEPVAVPIPEPVMVKEVKAVTASPSVVEKPVIREAGASSVTVTTTRSKDMAIPMSNYVDISSSFPEGSVADRSFGGVVFTPAEMLPDADAELKAAFDAGSRVGMSLSNVEKCFGVNSYEYKFAVGYYGYYSPAGMAASRLSFAKVMINSTYSSAVDYAPSAAASASDYATNVAYEVGAYVKQTTKTYKCITAVTAVENTGWSAVEDKFEEVTGNAYEADSYVKYGGLVYKCNTAVTLVANKSWDDVKDNFTVVDDSYETCGTALKRIVDSFDMFGSFTFLNLGKTDTGLVYKFPEAQLLEAATTNTGYGAKFLFVVNDVRGSQTATTVVTSKQKYNSAVGTAFISGGEQWSAYMPMAVFASTDFDNGTISQHMFRQFSGETPSVNGQDEYTAFKNGGVNFYGQTQCNGQTFDFYQRGVNTNGVDTSIYCNEVWFKSACAKSLLSYLVNQDRIPANSFGVEMVRTRVLEVCHSAQSNGSFMQKDVTSAEQLSIREIITSIGGSSQDVENIVTDISIQGYSVVAKLDTKDGDYMCHYWVFYGTGDSIKFIKGDDVMLK